MQHLTGLDSSFLYLDTPTTHMHVGCLNVYDGNLSFEDFKEFLASRLHMAPRLLQKLVHVPLGLGNPYWIDDADFDIDEHLLHAALPKPGDWATLRKFTSHSFGQPLNKTRPLWEFTFIEGLDNIPQVKKGSVGVVIKIHHSAIDGMSGAAILGILFDTTKKPAKVPPPPEKVFEKVPSNVTLLTKSYINLIKSPFKIPGVFMQTVKSTLANKKLSHIQDSDIPDKDFPVPYTFLNKKISSRRLWNSALLSFDRVKALKESVKGATLNDVIMTICTGALRRFMLEKDELPEEPLVAMVPVSVRDKAASKDMGNQISAMLIQLPTHIEDPIEQLRAVHKNTIKGKSDLDAIGAKQLANYAEFIPFAVGNQAARLYTRMKISNHHRPIVNLVITNVPGPQIPLYMNGQLMQYNMAMAPLFDGMGLSIQIMSYNGTLSISPTTATNIMPELDLFTRYIRESANLLEECVENL